MSERLWIEDVHAGLADLRECEASLALLSYNLRDVGQTILSGKILNIACKVGEAAQGVDKAIGKHVSESAALGPIITFKEIK